MGHAVLSHTTHVMMIDDSTTKNTRLSDSNIFSRLAAIFSAAYPQFFSRLIRG